jgi:hypothetical protein
MIRKNDGGYMVVVDHPILVTDSHELKMNVSKNLGRDTWHVYGCWS